MLSDDDKKKLRSVGLRIRSIRRAHKLNLNEIARMTGISASALSLIETGKRDPRLTTLARIAAVYRVSFADLLDDPPSSSLHDEGNDGEKAVQGYDLGEYL